MVVNDTALPAGADGCVLRPCAFLGGEDAGHRRAVCPRSGAARGIQCSAPSPTVSYCHILRNLGVGMELTGAAMAAPPNCILAASFDPNVVSAAEGANRLVESSLKPQVPPIWDVCRC